MSDHRRPDGYDWSILLMITLAMIGGCERYAEVRRIEADHALHFPECKGLEAK